MQIFLTITLLIIGLFLILKGGDIFVSSSIWMARIMHVKELIIGATIVSVGTTLPEFLTSLIATIKGVSMGQDGGYFALAVSNAVGSMLANSGLILALVIIIKPPLYKADVFKQSSIYVLLISLLIVIFMLTGNKVSIVEGVVLLILFCVFMIDNILRARVEDKDMARDMELYKLARDESKVKMTLSFIISAISIGVGAVLLVDNARVLARAMGISEGLIGVTLVAVGTSLPELVTSMSSLRKGSCDIGVGNILGAHMINATLIVGIIALVASGIGVDYVTSHITAPVLLLVMSILIVPTIVRGKFARWQGALMLAFYVAFLVYNAVVCIN